MTNSTAALAALKNIETRFENLGLNMTFTEISELAIAIHEIKSFIQSIKEKEDAEFNRAEVTNQSRARYQKFIVVSNNGMQHAMKEWLRTNENIELQQLSSKISHEISRILVNKYHFRKTIDTNANLALHYQPN
jgi:predicted RNase H-like nuclease (RuvC/YqgF family)